MSGLATLADDSGLVVDALDGRPGVRSARYAGDHATDRENLDKLLGEMLGIPPGRRTARFECAMALALPEREMAVFTGSVEGSIASEPAGDGGFGYDPVFVLKDPGTIGGRRTMAQLSTAQKASVSHRGLAARKVAEWLRCFVVEDAAPYN